MNIETYNLSGKIPCETLEIKALTHQIHFEFKHGFGEGSFHFFKDHNHREPRFYLEIWPDNFGRYLHPRRRWA